MAPPNTHPFEAKLVVHVRTFSQYVQMALLASINTSIYQLLGHQKIVDPPVGCDNIACTCGADLAMATPPEHAGDPRTEWSTNNME